MAQNTASPIRKHRPKHSSGIRRSTPIDCVGCRGPKEKRRELFCKKCKVNYLASKRAEQQLDEMFERAIA